MTTPQAPPTATIPGDRSQIRKARPGTKGVDRKGGRSMTSASNNHSKRGSQQQHHQHPCLSRKSSQMRKIVASSSSLRMGDRSSGPMGQSLLPEEGTAEEGTEHCRTTSVTQSRNSCRKQQTPSAQGQRLSSQSQTPLSSSSKLHQSSALNNNNNNNNDGATSVAILTKTVADSRKDLYSRGVSMPALVHPIEHPVVVKTTKTPRSVALDDMSIGSSSCGTRHFHDLNDPAFQEFVALYTGASSSSKNKSSRAERLFGFRKKKKNKEKYHHLNNSINWSQQQQHPQSSRPPTKEQQQQQQQTGNSQSLSWVGSDSKSQGLAKTSSGRTMAGISDSTQQATGRSVTNRPTSKRGGSGTTAMKHHPGTSHDNRGQRVAVNRRNRSQPKAGGSNRTEKSLTSVSQPTRRQLVVVGTPTGPTLVDTPQFSRSTVVACHHRGVTSQPKLLPSRHKPAQDFISKTLRTSANLPNPREQRQPPRRVRAIVPPTA